MEGPNRECSDCLYVGDNSNRCITCIELKRAKAWDNVNEKENGNEEE